MMNDWSIPSVQSLLDEVFDKVGSPEELAYRKNLDDVADVMDELVPTDTRRLLAMLNADQSLLTAPVSLYGGGCPNDGTLAGALRTAVLVRLDEALRDALTTARSVEEPAE